MVEESEENYRKCLEGVENKFAAECPATDTVWGSKNGFFEKQT